MLTVGSTLNIVAEGLRSIYGGEAMTIAHFALRLCRDRHDAAGAEVWDQVGQRIAKLDMPTPLERSRSRRSGRSTDSEEH